jgi:hypothetical protein
VECSGNSPCRLAAASVDGTCTPGSRRDSFVPLRTHARDAVVHDRALAENLTGALARGYTLHSMRRRILLGIALVALTVGPVLAEPTWKLAGSDSTYSYNCGGDDWVAINGKGNSLTIRGECAIVEINGSGNKITVESVGTIKISGNNNDIRYARAPEGKSKPVIKNKGAANTIRRDQ